MLLVCMKCVCSISALCSISVLYFISDTVYVKLQHVYVVCPGVVLLLGEGCEGLFGGGDGGGRAGVGV